MRAIPLLLLFLVLFSCNTTPKLTIPSELALPLNEGSWRLTFDLDGQTLPVNLNVRNESGLQVDFINATEVITAYEFLSEGDSLYLRMPLFNSEFCGIVTDSGATYSGLWRNYARTGDYSIPFTAIHEIDWRFCDVQSTALVDLDEELEVHFSPQDSSHHYPAIGMFKQDETTRKVTGTFATETGDYRFLEGGFCDNQLKMSCFDGSHAFLFVADLAGDSLQGTFWSGTHHEEPWTAWANEDFELRDPHALTYVVDSTLIWKTKFKDVVGEEHLLSSMGLEDKVVILQALGSWCPNCIDETREYVSIYNKFHDRGLEIVPIAFEKADTQEEITEILAELQKDLSIPYPLYYGGVPSKSVASEVFPSLNKIMSFPTSIVIGRDGAVHSVHTGFYGPGTHAYYDIWKHDMEMLIEDLLAAK